MRRSKKEAILLEPGNRLMHNDVHESTGMSGGAFAAEAAEEWASGHAHKKHSPRKPMRS
ncbi:hypothetical protein [Paenibacillus ginsengarvi]|uniref:hypothetical protein n=1 Tax=Paenibacillus ginsengarvi TaxID=400777 RepID=UPI00131541D9|nr:hypothetical protein [Paenibacillus ginsengarvi]